MRLIAFVIGAWSVTEVFVENLQPVWVAAPLMALGCSALYWRRRYPILVGIAIVSMATLQAAAGMSLHSAVGPVVGIFFVSWAIGAYETRPRAVLGLTILVCGMWIAMGVDMLRGGAHYEGTDFPWVGALVATPGVLGIAFGARTRRLQAAEAKAQRLELERREAVVAERARIARELHDVIAHSVSVMTVQAGAAEEMLKRRPGTRARAGACRPGDRPPGAGRDEAPGRACFARTTTRSVLHRNRGWPTSTAWSSTCARRACPSRFSIEGEPRLLPLGVDLSAYRVVQEALTNALKHAGHATAMVTVRYGRGRRDDRRRRRRRGGGEERRRSRPDRDARAHRRLRRHVRGRPPRQWRASPSPRACRSEASV